MDVKAEKLLLIEQLTKLQDVSILKKVKELLQSESTESVVGYDPDGSAVTQFDMASRAESSNAAIEERRTKSIDQLKDEIKKW